MSAAVHCGAFMVVVVGLTVLIFRAIALRIDSVSPRPHPIVMNPVLATANKARLVSPGCIQGGHSSVAAAAISPFLALGNARRAVAASEFIRFMGLSGTDAPRCGTIRNRALGNDRRTVAAGEFCEERDLEGQLPELCHHLMRMHVQIAGGRLIFVEIKPDRGPHHARP